MNTGLSGIVAVSALLSPLCFALDGNGNSQSDVWEMAFGASGLQATADADKDGWTNAMESVAGTNPFDALSHPKASIVAGQLQWPSRPGKRYTIQSSGNFDSWTPVQANIAGTGATLSWPLAPSGGREFFKIVASDIDTDGDGVNDWEELTVGFDPNRGQTGRLPQGDGPRVSAGLTAANTVTVSVYDDTCTEAWPDPALFVVRRSGGLQPFAVNLSLGGTADAGDYSASPPVGSIAFAAGQTEAFIEIHPVTDQIAGESTETVVLTALPGSGYTVGSADTASVSILDQPANGKPSAKEAARFLIQAGFGPDQDAASDPDQIPENVEEVMNMGIGAWIDDQLTRPIGRLMPMMQWQNEQPSSGPNNAEIYNDRKVNAWWGRAMGLPKLRPDATDEQLPDPLRQRVAFALSQIFVISERLERLGTEPAAMVHFYDKLLENSFGNFENLLRDVTLHPCMAHYLSYLDNRKADPLARTFPDENYAREVMQLFSIGLWMLNPDGTRVLNNGQPVPTYSNANITEFAKVFTGLSYGGMVNGSPPFFGAYDGDFTVPMKGYDAEHDLGPKTLLLGAATPARTASPGSTGTATMADVNAAIGNLFNHPNVGPFIGKLLIQRLVTSNPSPEYIGRVSAAFNAAPRGDLGRTVKAILMDPEARHPEKMSDPAFGKLREPYLKVVNMARAFNASSSVGWYYLDAFDLDHVEEPFNSPSVFNFYLPSYSPPGAMAAAGLVAPEMQIVNASSGVTAPNYYWGAITGGLHRWGVGVPARTTRLNLTQELAMSTTSSATTDTLIRRLDLVLTGGTLTPRSLQIIREAMMRIDASYTSDWSRERLKLAVYLIICSPEYSVQH